MLASGGSNGEGAIVAERLARDPWRSGIVLKAIGRSKLTSLHTRDTPAHLAGVAPRVMVAWTLDG
jgi:hypothetical protein